jgi:flagellar hook-length control protein FliK
MQNLSLNTSQAALSKKTESTMAKTNAESQFHSAENNTSFQAMLSKQVRSQQAPTQQVAAEKASVQPASEINESVTETAMLNQKRKAKGVSSQHAATNGMATNSSATAKRQQALAEQNTSDTNIDASAMNNSTNNSTTALDEQSKLDDNTRLLTKAGDGTQTEDVNVLAAGDNAALLPMMNAMSLAGNKLSESNGASQMNVALEASMQKQRTLDSVLNNSLIQANNINVQEKQAPDTNATGDALATTSQTQWLDTMLPNKALQAFTDESINSKSMLNVIKDAAFKNANLQSAGVQELTLPVAMSSAVQTANTLAATALGSANHINAYPGKTGWDTAISQKVVWMVGGAQQSATLTLNPPDLGPLQVVINVNNNQADATFISDNAEVRQALQDGMANLRDKMNESGVQLGQTNVNSGSQQFQQASQQKNSLVSLKTNDSAPNIEHASSASTLIKVSNGLVDTFA